MKYVDPLTVTISTGPRTSLCTNSSIMVSLGLVHRWGTAAGVVLETTQKDHCCKLLLDKTGGPRAPFFGTLFKLPILLLIKVFHATIAMTLHSLSLMSYVPHCPQLRTDCPAETQLQHALHFPQSSSAVQENWEYTFWVSSAHWKEWVIKTRDVKIILV